MLVCRRDAQNRHDPFAVATCKGTTVVGRVPRWISAICYVFLGKPWASIKCFVAGSRGCIDWHSRPYYAPSEAHKRVGNARPVAV